MGMKDYRVSSTKVKFFRGNGSKMQTTGVIRTIRRKNVVDRIVCSSIRSPIRQTEVADPKPNDITLVKKGKVDDQDSVWWSEAKTKLISGKDGWLPS